MFFLPLITGCATMALTGVGVGVSYTLSDVVYGSFSFPMNQVHESTIAALNNMGIKIVDDKKSENGRTIIATTKKSTL